MKLSDAILLGSTMRPQIRRRFSDGEGTCAMGAAFDGVGILDVIVSTKYGNERMALIESQFPGAYSAWKYSCPCEGAARRTECSDLRWLAYMVTHLNDDHFWTRERIASWVASVEPQEVLEVGEANQPGALDGVEA
jgi:hypothetical protein